MGQYDELEGQDTIPVENIKLNLSNPSITCAELSLSITHMIRYPGICKQIVDVADTQPTCHFCYYVTAKASLITNTKFNLKIFSAVSCQFHQKGFGFRIFDRFLFIKDLVSTTHMPCSWLKASKSTPLKYLVGGIIESAMFTA